MRSVVLVVKHEIASMLGKRSFWVMTFLFPLLVVVLNVGTQVVSQRAIESSMTAARTAAASQTVGYVDRAGMIDGLPSDIPAGTLRAFSDEASAQAALQAGEVERYYVIPADWVERGELVVVERQFSPLSNLSTGRGFRSVVYYNLVGDEDLARLLIDPTPGVESHALAPQGGSDKESPLTFWVPYATMFVFFLSLTMGSTMMLQSVAKEKDTRTAEVLLLSLRPRQLMLGKILSMGAVALFQLLAWAVTGLLVLGMSQRGMASQAMPAAAEIPAGGAAAFALPPGFFLWLVGYFVLGYGMYASALGAIGALAPSAREGAQFTFIVMLPLMLPLWLNTAMIQEPHGDLSTFLSLFPLTAPLAMVTRLAAGGVPAWQPAAGLAGLAVAAYLFVLLAARFFRADTLLSSASLSWQRVVKEFKR